MSDIVTTTTRGGLDLLIYTPKNLFEAPTEPAVYVHMTAGLGPLYVGRTSGGAGGMRPKKSIEQQDGTVRTAIVTCRTAFARGDQMGFTAAEVAEIESRVWQSLKDRNFRLSNKVQPARASHGSATQIRPDVVEDAVTFLMDAVNTFRPSLARNVDQQVAVLQALGVALPTQTIHEVLMRAGYATEASDSNPEPWDTVRRDLACEAGAEMQNRGPQGQRVKKITRPGRLRTWWAPATVTGRRRPVLEDAA